MSLAPRFLSLCLLTAALLVPAAALADKPASFGQKDPGLFNLKGTIYFLPEDTDGMPADLGKMKPQGVIYTDRLDIPERDFTDGFPGVTDRYEWFGLVYEGRFQIVKPGKYEWRLTSDDGARLWVDGKPVLDNDGVHSTSSARTEQELAAGPHTIKVWYFQGPAASIALQLFLNPPGHRKANPEEGEDEDANDRIFVLSDYASDLSAAMSKVSAEATPDGIRIKLDAAILFDTGKSALKPEAQDAIGAVAEVIRSYPGATVRIEGHTDSVGNDAANLKLSKGRADAVKAALAGRQFERVKLETVGLGKSRPAATNDTEQGRALNRRVEICIRP